MKEIMICLISLAASILFFYALYMAKKHLTIDHVANFLSGIFYIWGSLVVIACIVSVFLIFYNFFSGIMRDLK